jgi:hypothetical protein
MNTPAPLKPARAIDASGQPRFAAAIAMAV